MAQDFRWRLHVRDTRLDRPRAKTVNLMTPLNHNGQVLVPCNFPIRFLRLVEEGALDCEAILPDDRLGQNPQSHPVLRT